MNREADRAAQAYWEALSHQWNFLPPRSPGADDVAWFALASGIAGTGRVVPRAALLLGVTPALAGLPWPRRASLVALDWSRGMLERVWSRPGGCDWAAAVRADWREIPLASASRDLALGDVCYLVLGSFEDAARLNAEVRRVLRGGARYCLRSFVRPDRSETVGALLDEVHEGLVPDPSMFRWRLAMAVQGSSRAGVALDDVWRCWHERVADPARVAERHGWAPGALGEFERWKDCPVRFYFPAVAELYELAGPGFEVMSCEAPRYPWGERIRRVAMRARG